MKKKRENCKNAGSITRVSSYTAMRTRVGAHARHAHPDAQRCPGYAIALRCREQHSLSNPTDPTRNPHEGTHVDSVAVCRPTQQGRPHQCHEPPESNTRAQCSESLIAAQHGNVPRCNPETELNSLQRRQGYTARRTRFLTIFKF